MNLLSVAGVLHGHDGQDQVSHAMVLDTFDKENDKLIFKNTYDQEGQPKKVEVGRTDPNAPEELYFVHIEMKNNLPGQSQTKSVFFNPDTSPNGQVEENRNRTLERSCSQSLWPKAVESDSKSQLV